jgi:hypothetical protein
MLRRRYDKKKSLLFAFVSFLIIAVALTSYFVFSSGNFDSRSSADGEDTSFEVPLEALNLDPKIAMILEPLTGTIPGDGLRIDLTIDTQGEEVDEVSINLTYSGDIEYMGFEQGTIEGCEVQEVVTMEEIVLSCLLQTTYIGQGDVFASVIFEATDEGQAEIDITRVDFAELSFSGETGQYSTTLEFSGVQPSCGSLDNEIFAFVTESWPEGTFCSEGQASPLSPNYPEPGTTESWQCVSGENSVSCSAQREAAPPSCGTLDGQTFTYEYTTWPTGTFCSVGEANPSSPVFPGAGQNTLWRCDTAADSTSCSASKLDVLPEASILNNVSVFMGFVLVIISAILLVYKKKDEQENFSMRNKLCL